MIAVTVPAALATAPRRSYFLERSQELIFGLRWKAMLTALAPQKAHGLNPHEPMKCWTALLSHCATLFPTFEPEIDEGSEWEDEDYSPAHEAWSYGIPIDVMGVDSDSLHYGRSPALALAQLYGEYGAEQNTDNRIDVLHTIDTLKDVKSLRAIVHAPAPRDWSSTYDSRTWAPPWDETGLFLDYCHGSTGYQILDWSDMMIHEGGGYPEWSLEEIRGNAEEWKRAGPVWDRICKFQAYVDAKPEARLPILAGILTANPKITERYSVPKRPAR